MHRYFLEVAYDGTGLAGFQRQPNAVTVQQLIEEAMLTLMRVKIELTCSSRTDAGVHALQNYFHFDLPQPFNQNNIYRLNAILPPEIVVLSVREVHPEAHSRFDALHRRYQYNLHVRKDPFFQNRSWFYPYKLDLDAMQEAAQLLLTHIDFTSFAKRNSQVFTHDCTLTEAEWEQQQHAITFRVTSNRFLRGMVRALVATQVRVGRGHLSMAGFKCILEARDCTKAYFDAPAKGLFLYEVAYSGNLFE